MIGLRPVDRVAVADGAWTLAPAGTAIATSSTAGLLRPTTLAAVTTAANPTPARAC